MIIGMPKEIKEGEYRVAVTPSNISRLRDYGHTVIVEANAGREAGFLDTDYENAGAQIAVNKEEVFDKAEMIVKVKEILPEEFGLLKEGQLLMTYIHSANRRPQTEELLNKKMVAFAYEDVKDAKGEFPLLLPMSEIAGDIGLFTGVYHLFNINGGNGKWISGAPGVANVKIVIFGAGNVGLRAATLAVGMGADVTLMDTNLNRLRDVKSHLLPAAKTVFSNRANVTDAISDADLVINAVKWVPGLTIVSRDMLKHMKPNSLIVDIDAEPGGAIETSEYTTHEDPIVIVDGIRHIGIQNLPSAVAHTSSIALSNATIPYILEVANKGWLQAAKDNEALAYGLDFVKGILTFKPTADALGLEYTDVYEAMKHVEETANIIVKNS